MKNDHSNDMNTLLADTLGASMNFWGEMAASFTAPAMFLKLAENFSQNEEITRDLFSTFKTAAENVFGKFANIPQLGLTRSYQEKMLQVINKYNQFQSNMTDLGLLLHLPVKNAFAAVQKETAENMKNPANIKETYKRWVAILEENFMMLYKSPEYTRAMANTIQAMEGYIKVRDDVVSDFLKMLPIPTRKDAEGVYKDIYELKKKVRKLEKMSAAAA